MAEKSIEIEGLDDLVKRLEKIPDNLRLQVKDAMGDVALRVAQEIKDTFTGGRKQGFKDRTGALRDSINGGLAEELSQDDDVVGFVSAGTDSIGSDNKPTREYVEHVEFGEFRKAGHTSFLRAGVQQNTRNLGNWIAEEIDLEKLI